MYKRYGVWVLYFIYATLSVTIYILCTQKWAGGHTVPSRYGASADTYNCRTYRHIKYLYMVFLVKILFKHIVVDGGVKCTNDIYGGGIHMNPPLRMRTQAYTIVKIYTKFQIRKKRTGVYRFKCITSQFARNFR